jgi:hypothetical protein
VKRWHGGDQRERWVSSGLLVAEKQFRTVQGHKQIPVLIRELEALTLNMSGFVKRRRRRKVGHTGVVTFNAVPGVPEYRIMPNNLGEPHCMLIRSGGVLERIRCRPE